MHAEPIDWVAVGLGSLAGSPRASQRSWESAGAPQQPEPEGSVGAGSGLSIQLSPPSASTSVAAPARPLEVKQHPANHSPSARSESQPEPRGT